MTLKIIYSNIKLEYNESLLLLSSSDGSKQYSVIPIKVTSCDLDDYNLKFIRTFKNKYLKLKPVIFIFTFDEEITNLPVFINRLSEIKNIFKNTQYLNLILHGSEDYISSFTKYLTEMSIDLGKIKIIPYYSHDYDKKSLNLQTPPKM